MNNYPTNFQHIIMNDATRKYEWGTKKKKTIVRIKINRTVQQFYDIDKNS